MEKSAPATHYFALTLLQWFQDHGRDLPWRNTKDPYAIWLSEIILQQTQVKQGWSYWERFMKRWPTVELLAAATEDEVLREWQGLGYYSRARNLHFAARQIVSLGAFPQTLEGIHALKGVGDYTAAAIGSFAFGIPAAVVDGNVYRVLSRHFGIDTPINTTEGKKAFAALAQELLPPQAPAAYNQAIMDFGATLCTPQSPDCPQCPLQETCVALREGRVGQLPVKLKTLKVKERRLVYLYIRCNGYTAIHRRPAGDIWQGLYEPPLIEDSAAPAAPSGSPAGFSAAVPVPASAASTAGLPAGFPAAPAPAAAPVPAASTAGLPAGIPAGTPLLWRQGLRHVLTHRILLADVYLLITDTRPALPPDYIWIEESALSRYALPRLVEKFIATLPSSER